MRHLRRINLMQIPWFDVLHESVLPHLSLKDLYNLRCVSRSCKELVETYLRVLEKIDLSSPCIKYDQLAFQIILERCKNVKYLNLSKCVWLKDSDLINLLMKNDEIVHIDLTYCIGLSEKSLQPIINRCKSLKSLRLTYCYWLTSNTLNAIVHNHRNLEEIYLDKCKFLSEICIKRLIAKCTNIRRLSLAHIPSVSNDILRMISTYSMDLEMLNINYCKVNLPELKMIFKECKKLKEIKAFGCLASNYTELEEAYDGYVISNYHMELRLRDIELMRRYINERKN